MVSLVSHNFFKKHLVVCVCVCENYSMLICYKLYNISKNIFNKKNIYNKYLKIGILHFLEGMGKWGQTPLVFLIV